MPPFHQLIAEWKKTNQRLGQWFENQYGCVGSPSTACIYNMEDKAALNVIRRIYIDNQWEM